MAALGTLLRRIVILVLAVGLTSASLRYVRPAICPSVCSPREGEPCPCGSCLWGDQQAGFPLPALYDTPQGSFDIRNGIVDSGDWPHPLGFPLDVVFYSALLSLVWRVPVLMRSQHKSRTLPTIASRVVVLAVGLTAAHLIYGSTPTDLWPPDETAAPERRILGNWTATDDASGRNFIFYFGHQEHEPFSMQVRGRWYSGYYSILGDRTVEISLQDYTWLPDEQEPELCPNAPSLLKDFCQRSVEYPPPEPTQRIYPGPSPSPMPPSSPGPRSSPVPYPWPYSYPWPYTNASPTPDPLYTPPPVPTRAPWVVSKIEDAAFNVEFDGDMMVLTHSSGNTASFRSFSCTSNVRD